MAATPPAGWSPSVRTFAAVALRVAVVLVVATGSMAVAAAPAAVAAESPADDGTPPTARLDAPSSVAIDSTVTLDASGSDPGDDDEIAAYEWTIEVDGDRETRTTTDPTLEYAFAESGSAVISLVVVTDADRHDETADRVHVEARSLALEGTVVHPNGVATGRDTVALLDGDEVVAETDTATDGSFTLAPDDPGTYDLVYADEIVWDDARSASTNGRVDFYALERVTLESDESADVGRIDLPSGHELETTVVDSSGDPVGGATVTVTHRSNGASMSTDATTTDDGVATLPPSTSRLLEVSGAVDVEVEPPETGEYEDETVTETVTVDGPTSGTIELDERVDVSLSVDPESATVGDEVTVTVDPVAGADRIQAVTWYVDRERLERTTDDSVSFEPTRPGDHRVRAEVHVDSGSAAVAVRDVTVDRPNEGLALESPGSAAAYEPVSLTATFDERTSSIETYRWTIRGEDGSLVRATNTSEASLDVEFEDLGTYEVALETTDEFGLTESTTATVDVDSIPSSLAGSSRVVIDDVDAPATAEAGEPVSVTVTATNAGDAGDLVDVTLERRAEGAESDDAEVVADGRLELAAGETDAVTLTHAAPNRAGNETLVVSTAHDRLETTYAVRVGDDVPATDGGDGGGDDPAELDLLPVPSTDLSVTTGEPPRGTVRTAVIGGATTAILVGFGIVGYAFRTRPGRREGDLRSAGDER